VILSRLATLLSASAVLCVATGIGGCAELGQVVYDNSTEVVVPELPSERMQIVRAYLESQGYQTTSSSETSLVATSDHITVWPPYGQKRQVEVAYTTVTAGQVLRMHLVCRFAPGSAEHPWSETPAIIAEMETERQTIVSTFK
jgi:hypothetical protein